MIHNIISCVLLGITHAIAFQTMTERKFSLKTTVTVYSLFFGHIILPFFLIALTPTLQNAL